jgi:hypothetical protein
VELVYCFRELPRVATARPEVARVLQCAYVSTEHTNVTKRGLTMIDTGVPSCMDSEGLIRSPLRLSTHLEDSRGP